MKLLIYFFCQRSRNAVNRGQIIDTGIRHAPQTAKTGQQFLPALGTDAFDFLQS